MILVKKVASLIACLLIWGSLGAQPTGDGVTNPDDPVTDLVPLDDGLVILLVAGIAYGAKKAMRFGIKPKM